MTRTYTTGPRYRWLFSEAANLEWKCVEDAFAADLARDENTTMAVVDEVRAAVANLWADT